MRHLLSKIHKGQQGITGIETAIILIAFVIVASVFAYVVLSAGLFSTQEAKEAIHQGLEDAKSTIEIKGNIYGRMEAGVLTEIYFTVATTTGSDMIDFTDTSSANGTTENLVVISYSDAYQIIPTVNWTMEKLNTDTTDNLLDSNEIFMITVDLRCVSANATPEMLPGPYHQFQLEVKPPVGAVLIIDRTLPARIDQIVNLY